jgi:hypothetical protein
VPEADIVDAPAQAVSDNLGGHPTAASQPLNLPSSYKKIFQPISLLRVASSMKSGPFSSFRAF